MPDKGKKEYRKNEAALKAFGVNLRRIRNEKDLTQEELANRAGLTIAQVGRVERGEINSSLTIIFAIAEGLGVEVRELF